jgi:hypothetical protein
MRAAGQKEYVNLAKGLLTEISPLSFPDGATSNELNFTINKQGLIRERRKGFSYIYPLNTFAGATSKIENLFYWRGSGYAVAILTNDVPETFLRVHAIDENFTAVADVKIADALVSTQIAELTNLLVITLSNNDNPILLEYVKTTDSIVVNRVSLHVRDFELVNDGFTVSETPTSLSDNHKYNLYNAGWFVSKKDENQSGFPLTPTITTYFNAFSKYPSNADSVGVGMITNGTGELTFDPEYVRDAGLGNSLSPRGHYVFPINAYDRTNKLTFPALDGAPSSTLTALSTIALSGTPSYDPDTPNTGGGGGGGGGTVPFDPYPDRDEDGNPFIAPT